MQAPGINSRMWWAWVAVALLAALALRLLAAQGALWTDEAWSVVYAAEARTPAGVFLRINHDNNHHLVSLWLLAIGSGASPLLARLPAILAGVAAVPVAALIVGRTSRIGGLAAAALFALSPVLVTYGSEARGYAPMVLAALLFILLAQRSVEEPAPPNLRWWLALTAGLGMLCHLTMAAPVALVTLWLYLDRRAALGPDKALGATLRLVGPALLATVAVVLFVFAAAAASPAGMRLGGYLPFEWRDYVAAFDALAAWTTGFVVPVPLVLPVALALAVLAVAIRPQAWLGRRAWLYALLILAVPLAALLIRPGNAGFARYYLATAIGLLLLIAEVIGRAVEGGGRRRVLGFAALILMGIGSMLLDRELVLQQRGHPDGPVAAMAALAPAGAKLAIEPERLEATLQLAARVRGYPLDLARGCTPAPFLLVGHGGFDPVRATIDRCGLRYLPIADGRTPPLSGDAWTLYRAGGLQSDPPPVSGRPPQAVATAPLPAERA